MNAVVTSPLIARPAIEAEGVVHARAWTHPITRRSVDFEVRYGATVAEMVAAVPLAPEDEWRRQHLEVRIAGHVIPRDRWHLVRPKAFAADRPVTVQIGMPVQGKGARKILMILASILLIALTVFISGGGLATTLGAKFGEGMIGAKIAAAAVSLAGNFLLQGLMKPPEPKKEPGANQIGQASIGNQFAPGSGLQRIVGRTLCDPKHIVTPWSTITAGTRMSNGAWRYSQFSHAILALAGLTSIERIDIDGVDATNMLDVVTEVVTHRRGGPRLTNVTATPREDRVGIEMSGWAADPDDVDVVLNAELAGTVEESAPIEHLVETGDSPDRVRLEFFGPRGWAWSDDNKAYTLMETLRIRMQRWTGSAWGGWVNLPELLIRGKEVRAAVRLHLEIVWVDTLPPAAGNAWPPTAKEIKKIVGWAQAFTHAAWPSPLLTAAGTDRWAEWEWDGDKVIRLYLLRSQYPQGRYRFGLKKSWPAVYDFWNRSTCTLSTGNFPTPVSDLFTPPVIVRDGVTYTERLRWTPQRASDTLQITTLLNWWNFYPVRTDTDEVLTLIYVRLRDRAASRISVVGTSLCASWNGTTWVADQPTDNPADLYRHVLADFSHNAKARSVQQIDLPALQDWAEWCDAEGLTVGFIADGMTVPEVLSEIALAGIAAPSRGMVESIVPDRARTSPVGVITARNSRDQATLFPLPDLPHALRVTFADQANDWHVREIAVYFPGYGPASGPGIKAATRFESVTYRGIQSEAHARRRAALDVNWMLYRTKIRSCEMPVERLEYRRGDRVLLHMDMLGTAGGSGRAGRVTDVLIGAGGLVEGLVIDEEVSYGVEAQPNAATLADIGDLSLVTDLNAIGSVGTPVARPIGCVIRRDDGVTEVRRTKLTLPPSAAGYPAARVIAFVDPFEMPRSSESGDPEYPGTGPARITEGSLVVTGAISTIVRDVLVWSIRPSGDLHAEVEMIDYAGDIFYPGA